MNKATEKVGNDIALKVSAKLLIVMSNY